MHYKLIILILFSSTIEFLNGQCIPDAYNELNIGNSRVGIMNNGTKWSNQLSEPSYEFLVNFPSSTPLHSIFTGGIWISGYDTNDSLKMAGMTYTIQGNDFYSGPIYCDMEYIADTNYCNFYNRLFTITKSIIIEHQDNHFPIPINLIDTQILNWPSKGNTYLHSQGIVINEHLAPFIDVNNNDIYDPENGDFPLIKGDQAIFWIMNDMTGPHVQTGGSPLGIEILAMAYSFEENPSSTESITYYDYSIRKKGLYDLHDCIFSLYVDLDTYTNSTKFIGIDTTHNFFYQYFGKRSGEIIEPYAFPMTSIKLLDNNQGVTTSSFFALNSSNPVEYKLNNPQNFRAYQEGKWHDNSEITMKGNGYQNPVDTNLQTTLYMYAGHPCNCENNEWSHQNNDLNLDCEDEFNFLIKTHAISNYGNFSLNHGDVINFSFSVFNRSKTLVHDDFCHDYDTLLSSAISMQNFYDTHLKNIDLWSNETCNNHINSIKQHSNQNIEIYPNPARQNSTITIKSNNHSEKVTLIGLMGNSIGTFDIANSEFVLGEIDSGIYFLLFQNETKTNHNPVKLIISQ